MCKISTLTARQITKNRKMRGSNLKLMALVVKVVEAVSITNLGILKSIILESTLHLDRRDCGVVSGLLLMIRS